MKTLFILLYLFVVAVFSASAEDYYPADSSVIGKVEQYTIKKGESLIELARKFDLGYNEITDANPGVDPFVPPAGIPVQIPMKWIVPDVPKRKGIVINISEMRLYYFTGKGTNMMTTFPSRGGRRREGDSGWRVQGNQENSRTLMACAEIDKTGKSGIAFCCPSRSGKPTGFPCPAAFDTKCSYSRDKQALVPGAKGNARMHTAVSGRYW